MLSDDLKARVAAIVEKYRQQEVDFLEMIGKIDNGRPRQPESRIRVRAISYRWSLPDSSTWIAGEQ